MSPTFLFTLYGVEDVVWLQRPGLGPKPGFSLSSSVSLDLGVSTTIDSTGYYSAPSNPQSKVVVQGRGYLDVKEAPWPYLGVSSRSSSL